MVVRYQRFGFDSCSCQEIHKGSLKLGLSCFEIVSYIDAGFDLVHSRQERVLWWTVDEGATWLHSSDCKDSGWRDLTFVFFNRLYDSFVTAVQAFLHHCESFSISSPENQNVVQLVFFLEITDIFLDYLQMLFLALSLQNVIGSLGLVCRNKIRVIDRFQGHETFHVGHQL